MSMDMNSQKGVNLANKSFGDILADGFKLFFRIYGKIILPLAFFQVLIIILDILLLTDFRLYVNSRGNVYFDFIDNLSGDTLPTPSDMRSMITFLTLNLTLSFLQNLIGAIIITIAICSVSNYTYKKYMGEDISVKESFKSLFNKKILIVLLIIGVFLPLTSYLLFIPGIFIFSFFIFLVFTYNMEEKNEENESLIEMSEPEEVKAYSKDRSNKDHAKKTYSPIKEARAIGKGAFWKIIGVFVITNFLIITIRLIFTSTVSFFLDSGPSSLRAEINSWDDLATRNYGMLILYQILLSVIDIIFAPLFICLLTSLFSSMKAKKDLGPQYQKGYYPIRGYYAEKFPESGKAPYKIYEDVEVSPPSEIEIKDRLYCPYCGFLITTPKKFCPNCGENLSDLIA